MENYCPEIELHRHQLVPLQITDTDKSFEKLQTFILDKVIQDHSLKKTGNSSSIEIEAKLGRFVFQNNEHFKMYQVLKQVSRNNLVLLSEHKDLPYRFESAVEKPIFDNFQIYMDLVSQQARVDKTRAPLQDPFSKLLSAQVHHNKEVFSQETLFEDVIVDFILSIREADEPRNQRISFSYSKQEFSRLSKQKNKSDSIDLVHNEIQFRISAAVETNVEGSQEELVQHLVENAQHIQQIRIKQRKSLRWELFQFDSSKVTTIEKKQPVEMKAMKETLKELMCEGEITVDGLNQQIQQMVLDSQRHSLGAKYEIELEIVDLQYLHGFLQAGRQLEVASLVKRFLRNVESVVFIQRLVHKHLSHGVTPVIGQYLLESQALQ